MKKAFDQTVRELKREVNKKVLKVPGVEQKILDATSNELWGPHGSLLADIAQATRNYHEYQIIMHVIWKRLNDTGKNWRHVYKSLTVLEYLVGHGSERVIDEIKEHVYQISTLSDFQYIDSSGKDQGNNVRRKSQALVSLINDKEKILEVRQKALANKDKFRPTFSSGGSYKPGSYSSASGYGDRYDEDRYEGRYGSRDDDRNGYEREKDSGYKDDDRYSKGGDFYRDGDGYGRDSDEHSGRGSYKNDDNRGDRGNDDYQLGPRNKSLDKDREHSYEEDDNYSYRNGGGRVNDSSPEGRYNERKPSEQNVVAPPNYESAVRNSNNNTEDQRDGGIGTITDSSKFEPAARKESLPPQSTGQAVAGVHLSPQMMDDTFDEFDPRGFTPAVNSAPVAASFTSSSGGPVVDLFGNSSPMDPADSLALVLAAPTIAASETETGTTNSGFGMDFVALSTAAVTFSQPTEDPFGDAPFKAVSHENFPNQEPYSAPMVSARASFPLSSSSVPSSEPISTVGSMLDTASMDFGFGGPLSGLTYMPSSNSPLYAPNPSITTSELPLPQPNIDALNTHLGHSNLYPTNTLYPHASAPVQVFASTNAQTANSGFIGAGPSPVHSVHPVVQPNMPSSVTPKTSSNNISALSNKKQDTFETKSSVWADTLNRGIVNLNISGAKTNPLADIGVDFDSINRLERRKEKEKSSANLVTSTVTMGKAMGSGSGIGRAGAGAISQTTRPAVSGMGMGMGMGPGGPGGMGMGMGMGPGGPGGMGMGSYGATMNQTMGLGMGMGQGSSMRPLPEMQSPPPVFPGAGYNSSTGMGGYASHQPYGGGGYR